MSDRHIKTASLCPDLTQALSRLEEPEDGVIRLVITALTAYEAYGPNRNGDAFFEDHLKRLNDYGIVDGQPFEVPMFKSFEQFARPYRHHINRPDSPAYGRVLSSVYNEPMKRVELIVELDCKKAPDLAERLNRYEPVGTSMGFRCMKGGDVCSICGHKAPSRRSYCDHLKHDMLRVFPGGKQAFAINPWGKFFDISFVIDPADPTSRAVHVGQLPWKASVEEESVAKTAARALSSSLWTPDRILLSAELGAAFYGMDDPTEATAGQEKVASEADSPPRPSFTKDEGVRVLPSAMRDKLSNIEKRIPANVEMSPKDTEAYRKAMQAMGMAMMPKKVLRSLGRSGTARGVASAAGAGVDVMPQEAQYMALYDQLPKTAERLLSQGEVLDPSTVPHVATFDLFDHMDAKTASVVLENTDLMKARSMHRAWLQRRTEDDAAAKMASERPLVPARRSVSAEEIQRVAEEEGESDRDFMRRLSVLAGILLGVNFAGDSMGLDEKTIRRAIGGASAVEYATRSTPNRHRMPIHEMRQRRKQEGAKERFSRSIMNHPMASQYLMAGSMKTAGRNTMGALSRSMRTSLAAVEAGARRLSASTPSRMAKVASRLGVSRDVFSVYDDIEADDLLVAALSESA